MLYQESHPSDRELLMAADGEFSSRREATVRQHLASCWSCRARMQEIETAITGFVHLHHQELDSKLPPIDGPWALLRARLGVLAAEPERNFGSQVLGLFRMHRANDFVSAALLCAMVVVLAIKFVWFT